MLTIVIEFVSHDTGIVYDPGSQEYDRPERHSPSLEGEPGGCNDPWSHSTLPGKDSEEAGGLSREEGLGMFALFAIEGEQIQR